MEKDERLYQIALTRIPGIGDILAKKLLHAFGSASAIFAAGANEITAIEGIGQLLALKMVRERKEALIQAEQELIFIDHHNIQVLFYTDSAFPSRLRHCPDSPVLLYGRYHCDLNAPKVIGIVGTRRATDYGIGFCQKLIATLKPYQPLIVSGLALGIDTCAHRESIKNDLPTVGIMGTGMDKLYPPANKSLAQKMIKHGGLLTEFPRGTPPDKENFPMRNRIVAGLCDAIVVVEAAATGGALITADIANSYSRDVFALPGRLDDPFSAGCNRLIKINKAALIESAADIAYLLGWDKPEKATQKANGQQRQMFVELNPEEQILLQKLENDGEQTIDALCFSSGIPMSKASALLLQLEFNGLVCSLPGKVYRIVS